MGRGLGGGEATRQRQRGGRCGTCWCLAQPTKQAVSLHKYAIVAGALWCRPRHDAAQPARTEYQAVHLVQGCPARCLACCPCPHAAQTAIDEAGTARGPVREPLSSLPTNVQETTGEWAAPCSCCGWLGSWSWLWSTHAARVGYGGNQISMGRSQPGSHKHASLPTGLCGPALSTVQARLEKHALV